MKQQKTKFTLLGAMILLCFTLNNSHAQTANTYVHAGAKMHVFGGENMSVWGNATNFGTWGSEENGLVWFYGATWTNDNAATMPGAGTFYFQQPRPAPYANNVKQDLEGGYDWASSTGCSFPDITLENANDLYLINDDSKVRDTFNFVDGHVIHDKMDFTVGDNDPGTILNYNETQFFVTNGDPTDTEGFLEREGMQTSDGTEDFPIGNAVGDYTPGDILQEGTQDDMSMRVFVDVFVNGRVGTLHNTHSVARTWDVEERTTGGSDVTLGLQHNAATEGGVFNSRRNEHYVTHYVGTAPNGPANGNGVDTTSGSEWDLLTYAKLYAGEAGNGFITTGTAIANAIVTRRDNLDAFSPYTKTVYEVAPLPVVFTHFDVIKASASKANVIWGTSMEQNTSHFDIERSLNGRDFEKVGEEKAKGGLGLPTEYSFKDNISELPVGYVYYRLRQQDLDGTFSYSKIKFIEIDGNTHSDIKVYPNPSNGEFFVSMNKDVESFNYNLYNSVGQKVQSGTAKNGQAVSAKNLSSGIYTLRLNHSVHFIILE